MAQIESGIGVSWRPVECSQPLVFTPGEQDPNILTAPLFGAAGSYWFSEANRAFARTMRVFFPRRLWTSATDPTDPGLVYGIHWRLGLFLSSEGSAGIIQSSYIDGPILQPGQNVTDARTRVVPTSVFLTPEVPEFISLQPPAASSNYLTMALIIADEQPQTYCLPVDLSIGQTWTA